jgi:limonene-1,2-epoxide hydrolase
MTTPSEAPPAAGRGTAAEPIDVVRRFLQALADVDTDTAIELVADDLVYENVSLPTIRGKERFARGARTFARRNVGFDVRIHRIAQSGTTVLTERTDALFYGRFRSQFWVCGVFEVVDGRITLWRDYFDWGGITVATLRGVLGIAVPSLAARFTDER